MTEFTPSRNRDAWAAIRGFVYQVDSTIVRWLDLEVGDALQLELGEDIDRISAAVQDERLLEQIKSASQPISLSSAAALEALANAIDHSAANPKLRLLFRFTTTAAVALERTHPDPNMKPGIELWEEVRRDVDGPHGTRMDSIASLLRAASCPRQTPLEVWSRARTTFADDAELRRLVDRFEWSCGAVAPDALPSTIIAALQSSGRASSAQRAHQLYGQLFVHVFRLLSRRGPKRLTKNEVDGEVDRYALSELDRALAQTLRASFDSCGIRVDALASRVEVLDDQVRAIAQHVGFDIPAIVLDSGVEDCSPPSLVARLAPRRALVAMLSTERSPWLALHGEAGIGKSHLAQLVARSGGRVSAWFRLSTDVTARDLVRRLRTWTRTAAGTRADVLGAVAAVMESDGAIVLEDLPRLGKDSDLGRLLMELSSILRARARALITTSWYPLPVSVAQQDRDLVTQRECPLFTDEEAGELFGAYGGERFVSKHRKAVRSYNAFARNHPTLLTALAVELSQRGWIIDGSTFEGILDGTYASATHAETIDFLNRTTADAEARELLLRLALVGSAFDSEVIHALAKAPPPIERALDRLDNAMGIWVREEGKGRLRLSPLLAALPKQRLAAETARACHRILAAQLLKAPLDQDKGASVVLHQVNAGDLDRAATTLGMLLEAIASDNRNVPPGMLLELWWTQPLPEGMSVAVQLFVRNAQRRAGERYGKDVVAIDRDTEALLSRASDADQWAVALVEMSRFQRLFGPDPARSVGAFRNVLDAADRARLPSGAAYPFPDLSGLAWIQASAVKSREHIRAWLSLIARLPVSARGWRHGSLTVKICCQLVCDRQWLDELDRPVGQQRWSEVHEILDMIIKSSREIQFPYLEACALRAKVAVLCEHNHRFDEGISTAKAFLAAQPDREISVLMHDLLGRQYFHAGRYNEALEYLRLMLVDGPKFEPDLSCLAANYASRAAAEILPAEALVYAQRAVDLADSSPSRTDQERARARGELAIAQWYAGARAGSVAVLLDAAEIFHKSRDSSSSWKPVGVGLTQVAAMFSGAVFAERAPAGMAPGKGRLPAPGYLYSTPNLAKFWREDFPTLLAFQLCPLAESTGDIDRAKVWASRVLDATVEMADGMLPLFQLPLVPYILLTERADAIDAVMAATFRIVEAARSIAAAQPPIETPSGLILSMALIPTCMALGLLATEDRARARDLAVAAAARVRSFSGGAADLELWREAARLMEAPFLDPSAAPSLLEFASQLSDDADALRTLAVLQATVCDDVILRDAAIVHLQHVPRLVQQGLGAEPYILARWIERYWTSTFQRSRFAFVAPGELAREFAALAPLALETRLRRILGLVARGLGIRLTPELSAWCDG